MTNTTGSVYFAIKTEDDALGRKQFDTFLSIMPTKFSKKFEKGIVPVCTVWEYSSGSLENAIYFEELESIVSKLNTHTDEFLNLKKHYIDVEFVLEIVIYLGDDNPGLHFSKKTLGFITKIGAVIDCDIFNAK